MSKILVVGATGTVGSEIVKGLKAEGHQVRVSTSRKPTSSEQVQINLLTGEGVHAAFEGIARAFFLSPGGIADSYKTLSPLIQEAKRRGLKKVVLMTAMGVNANPENPARRAELELEKSGLPYNIIRPNWFMQNFNTYWVQGIREQGKILLPAGQAKTSFIDTRDISAVAVKLLIDDSRGNRDFDITGSKALDHDEVAAEIARATGRKVVYEQISNEAFKAGLLKAGASPEYTELLALIMGFLRDGYNAGVTTNVREILGREPRSFAQYASDFKPGLI